MMSCAQIVSDDRSLDTRMFWFSNPTTIKYHLHVDRIVKRSIRSISLRLDENTTVIKSIMAHWIYIICCVIWRVGQNIITNENNNIYNIIQYRFVVRHLRRL